MDFVRNLACFSVCNFVHSQDKTDKLVEGSFSSVGMLNLLERVFTMEDLYCEIGSEEEEMLMFLQPHQNTKPWQSQRFEEFERGNGPRPRLSIEAHFTRLSVIMYEKLQRVLWEYKGAFGWTIHDIKGINPTICTHRIYEEDGYEPKALLKRRLNPNMKQVVKREMLKLQDADSIYPISDSK